MLARLFCCTLSVHFIAADIVGARFMAISEMTEHSISGQNETLVPSTASRLVVLDITLSPSAVRVEPSVRRSPVMSHSSLNPYVFYALVTTYNALWTTYQRHIPMHPNEGLVHH